MVRWLKRFYQDRKRRRGGLLNAAFKKLLGAMMDRCGRGEKIANTQKIISIHALSVMLATVSGFVKHGQHSVMKTVALSIGMRI